MKFYFKLILVIIVLALLDFLIYHDFSSYKKDLKKLKVSMDINNPTTRKFALDLASEYPGEFNIDQVCNIYDYIFKNWKYVNDPRGIDYFAKASQTIENNLTGDCDDFAILIATTIESIGGKTRINLALNKKTKTGHAFTEVYFNDDPKDLLDRINYHYQNLFQKLFGIPKVKTIHYSPDKHKGLWLNLDWNSRYPGGEYFDYDVRIIFYPRENRIEK